MKLTPFSMERWQSTFEHRVEFNLSESGVHPLTVGELLELGGHSTDLGDLGLGYGQSNGSDQLRTLVADLYPGATEASVVVTTGGAEANFAAFWHLAAIGGPAAVTLPNYMQVPGLAENFEGQILPVHLRPELRWQPDLDQLESALVRGARFLLITNPNNPTGAALTDSSMEAIVRLADRHGAWILADEVYQGAEVRDETTPSFWGRYDRVIVTNSLSKAYGLPGLRIGWAVADPEVTRDLWARTDYTTIAPSSVSDALAIVALHPDVRARIIERTRGIIRRNLPVLTDWLDRHEGLFEYQSPDAGAICYTRYDAPVDSVEFAERLRVEHSVLVVPGGHFGMDRYLRLGIGPPAAELSAALDRLADAFRLLTTA